jgi:hypothetical protein
LWIAIGSVLGALTLLVVFVAGGLLRPSLADSAPAPALTDIPLPATHTPVPTPSPPSTATPPASPTPSPAPTGASGAVRLGQLVEVFGTGGDGLRLRTEPSLAGQIRGLGLENEVFEVREGPVEADGHIWWFLVSPSTLTRQGWAVGAFLRPLDAP